MFHPCFYFPHTAAEQWIWCHKTDFSRDYNDCNCSVWQISISSNGHL